MTYSTLIRKLSYGVHDVAHLEEEEAYQLFSAMLDDGVSDLELGAIVMALRIKSESIEELLGFYRALAERVYPLNMPTASCRPVVLPSYSGALHQANLLPLLALLLRDCGVPVVIHGTLQSNGRVTTASILRELGILPCINLPQAVKQLNEQGLVFLHAVTLCPGLAALMTLRERMGLRNSAHAMAKLIDPFSDGCLRVVSVADPLQLEKMRDFLTMTGARALLLQSTDGEGYADPMRRQQMEFINDGSSSLLCAAEQGEVKHLPQLPDDIDAHTTAGWIRRVMAKEIAVPQSVISQLACCLYGCGYADDMSQASAIAASKSGNLVSA
jgi:anthranilate phosphoribosyltransferase